MIDDAIRSDLDSGIVTDQDADVVLPDRAAGENGGGEAGHLHAYLTVLLDRRPGDRRRRRTIDPDSAHPVPGDPATDHRRAAQAADLHADVVVLDHRIGHRSGRAVDVADAASTVVADGHLGQVWCRRSGHEDAGLIVVGHPRSSHRQLAVSVGLAAAGEPGKIREREHDPVSAVAGSVVATPAHGCVGNGHRALDREEHRRILVARVLEGEISHRERSWPDERQRDARRCRRQDGLVATGTDERHVHVDDDRLREPVRPRREPDRRSGGQSREQIREALADGERDGDRHLVTNDRGRWGGCGGPHERSVAAQRSRDRTPHLAVALDRLDRRGELRFHLRRVAAVVDGRLRDLDRLSLHVVERRRRVDRIPLRDRQVLVLLDEALERLSRRACGRHAVGRRRDGRSDRRRTGRGGRCTAGVAGGARGDGHCRRQDQTQCSPQDQRP